jgi:hypothetical protein
MECQVEEDETIRIDDDDALDSRSSRSGMLVERRNEV